MEILASIHDCCKAVFLKCADNVESNVRFNGPEIVGFSTGLPIPIGNMILETRCTEEWAKQHAPLIVNDFRDRGIPLLWWANDRTEPSNLIDILLDLGASRLMTTPEMAAAFTPENTTLNPREGLIVRETTPEEDELWVQVAIDVFHMPHVVAKMFGKSPENETERAASDVIKVIAWEDGKPVAISCVGMNEQVAGIFCVATLARARGRGLGTEVTKAAMKIGQEFGCKFAILQASDEGLSVYEKLGFKEYGTCERMMFASQSLT
jgi:ribosomal protein S18 acetylase RimI-like enzyme